MELVLLVGLQGAGKSTFARQRFGESHVYVSKDQLRNNRHPRRRELHLVEAALRAGQSVVVDNTNPTIEERAALITLGHAYGAHVAGYFFPPDVAASRARNAQREGKARVPVVAIYATAKKLTPPSYAEGFDALSTVATLPDGVFAAAPLPREP